MHTWGGLKLHNSIQLAINLQAKLNRGVYVSEDVKEKASNKHALRLLCHVPLCRLEATYESTDMFKV